MCLDAPPPNFMMKQLYFKVDVTLLKYEYIIQPLCPMQDTPRIWVCQVALYPLHPTLSDVAWVLKKQRDC